MLISYSTAVDLASLSTLVLDLLEVWLGREHIGARLALDQGPTPTYAALGYELGITASGIGSWPPG